MTNGVSSVPSSAAADGSGTSSAKTGTNDATAETTITVQDQDDKSESNANKSERARQRWAILRSALLGNSDDVNSNSNGTRENTNNSDEDDMSNSNANAHASTTPFVNRASIHRFEGFQLLDRKLVPSEDAEICANIANEILRNNGEDEDQQVQQDEHAEYEYAEYTIPVPTQLPAGKLSESDSATDLATNRVRTRERRRRTSRPATDTWNANADDAINNSQKRKRIDQVMRGLLSHRLHGVDNTGQACVWDSESTLTYCLLAPTVVNSHMNDAVAGDAGRNITPPPFPLGMDNILSLAVAAVPASSDNTAIPKRLRVIELGAGMAGLCGLSLAAFGIQSPLDVDIDLTLTDGHPDAVRSNRICAALTSQLHTDANANGNNSNRNHITCHRLLWNDGKDGVEDCRALTRNGQDRYQLCLASDCVHFQEFHAALIATIGRLLDVGGVCLLCQPRRADSLANFMKVVDAVNTCSAAETSAVFDINLYERYNQRLWDLHQKELAKGDDGIYDPDIHYPLLLVLKKVGEYREEMHTAAAVQHVRERHEII